MASLVRPTNSDQSFEKIGVLERKVAGPKPFHTMVPFDGGIYTVVCNSPPKRVPNRSLGTGGLVAEQNVEMGSTYTPSPISPRHASPTPNSICPECDDRIDRRRLARRKHPGRQTHDADQHGNRDERRRVGRSHFKQHAAE